MHGFDPMFFVIAGAWLFVLALVIVWFVWVLMHPDSDPMEESYGPTAFEDTPFVIEQLTSLDRVA